MSHLELACSTGMLCVPDVRALKPSTMKLKSTVKHQKSELLGALDVSGRPGEQDEKCAMAGTARIEAK
jgi:hypothetical protein